MQRGGPSKTQSYDGRLEKTNLSLDHQSGCSPGGRPALREDFRVPIRGIHKRVSKSNTRFGVKEHRSLPMPPLGCVTGQGETSSDHVGNQKERQMEDGQQHCAVREIGETGSNPVRSEQKPTKLHRSHRLSSPGAYLWQTSSWGRLRPSLTEAVCS